MTRQEVIERLKSIKSLVDKYDDVMALREAIKALERAPMFIAKPDGTIEQIKNCDDCLYKREWEKIGKLIKVVLEKQTEQEPCGDWYDVPSDEMTIEQARQAVKDLRKKLAECLEQEPKTGHWEWVQYDYNPKLGNWHCSECRCVVVKCVDKNEKGCIPLYKYCPQCGTKMIEPKTESEGTQHADR
jgi:hypothetical protein